MKRSPTSKCQIKWEIVLNVALSECLNFKVSKLSENVSNIICFPCLIFLKGNHFQNNSINFYTQKWPFSIFNSFSRWSEKKIKVKDTLLISDQSWIYTWKPNLKFNFLTHFNVGIDHCFPSPPISSPDSIKWSKLWNFWSKILIYDTIPSAVS